MFNTGRVGAKIKYKRFVSTIIQKLPSLAFGAVLLNKPICGIRYWNMSELKYIKKEK